MITCVWIRKTYLKKTLQIFALFALHQENAYFVKTKNMLISVYINPGNAHNIPGLTLK